MLWSVLQPAAHHLCRNSGRIQSWLIFPKSEMFWHVYLFNLFILTSSDYNWQQRAELTLGSVLDLSVTITRKECEAKSTQCLTIAGRQGSQYMGFLSWQELQPQPPISLLEMSTENCTDYLNFFLLFNKNAPLVTYLEESYWKIMFCFSNLFNLGICFLGVLLFYGSLEINSQQLSGILRRC